MPEPWIERTAVIIGVGEVIDRPDDLALSKEPLRLMAEALRIADRDPGGGWLHRIDSLDVVNSMTWGYDNLPSQLSESLGMRPGRAVYGEIGGNTPVQYIHDAAIRIARGQIETAAVCGAEAAQSLMRAQHLKTELPWTKEATKPPAPRREGVIHPLALRHGLNKPLVVYPMFEYASSASWGQSLEQAQNESAGLWSQLSQVAAANPFAWSRQCLKPEEIKDVSPQNRLVAGPYTKHMVANPTVNQGGAVLLTSFAQAKKMNIPEDRMVFVWGGHAASELADFASRDQYVISGAMTTVLQQALRLSRQENATVDLAELYSCFPCVPKMARRILNWSEDNVPTMAGGLTFFGGPYNNYMTHAATAMVRKLRNHEEQVGLLYGQGGFLTKHHTLVIATRPPKNPISGEYDVQAQADSQRQVSPPIDEMFVGKGRVETYTILYNRENSPESVVVFARNDAGRRVLARADHDDAATLDFFTHAKRSPIGSVGETRMRGDGLLGWHV